MRKFSMVAASVLALTASMGHAATILDKNNAGGVFDVLADTYQFQDTFGTGTTGATLSFTFQNNSANDVAVTLSSATILQSIASYFTGGATVSWASNGVVTTAAQGNSSGGNLNFNLAAGASDTLSLTFGDIAGAGNGAAADIDFLVTASVAPVPLPAGMLLMGTALAGFGVVRRRKS